MYQVIIDLKKIILKDYNFLYYFLTFIFISTLIFLNYYFKIEKEYIEQYNLPQNWNRVFLYHLLYISSIYGVIFIRKLSGLDCYKFFTLKFLFYINFGVFLIALDAGFPYYFSLTYLFLNTPYYYYMHYIITDSYCIVTTCIPLLLFYFFIQKDSNYFGLGFQKSTFTTYFYVLLVMAPIIYVASLQPDILSYYPRFNKAQIAQNHPLWAYLVAVFEFFYSFDFISTELIFRGFMVIFLSKYASESIILPVAAAYCCIHFGKPCLETISSFVGGYALGLLSYHSQNIWGGVFVHVGIALLMEFFTFF